MSKRWIWSITVVMAATVTLLIFVQGFWINNAFRVNERQFYQLCNKSLTAISNDIQRQSAYSQIISEFYHAPDISVSPGEDFSNFSDHFQQMQDSLKNSEEIATEQEGTIQKKREFISRILDQMLNQTNSITDFYDNVKLENLISHHLKVHGINLNFEFAVLKNNKNFVLQSEHFSGRNSYRLYSTPIFPDDPFSPSESLIVYFPQQKQYLVNKTGYIIFASASLSLVIILTFSLTLFTIYRQKKTSEIKNDFVNNMTHELKTPISTISLASQMLGDPGIPIESKNFMHISKVISEESKRLSFQVEKVLQTATFDRGKLKLRKREVSLHEILNQTIGNFSFQIQARQGQIHNQLKASNDLIFGDAGHLANVVSNLLDNALKYSPTDPVIEVETFNENQNIILTVKDYGLGISKTDQRHIFDKFFRVSTGDRHDVKGFGLGLSYVKKIVDEHNGSIKLQSFESIGTTFYITFPLISKNE